MKYDMDYDKKEIFKPGFVRFSLPYFMDLEKVDYILKSIEFVAEHGWKFVLYYSFDILTGDWVLNELIDVSKTIFTFARISAL